MSQVSSSSASLSKIAGEGVKTGSVRPTPPSKRMKPSSNPVAIEASQNSLYIGKWCIGVVGAGNIARAIVEGLILSGKGRHSLSRI